MPRQLGPEGTQLPRHTGMPRHTGPPGSKMGGGGGGGGGTRMPVTPALNNAVCNMRNLNLFYPQQYRTTAACRLTSIYSILCRVVHLHRPQNFNMIILFIYKASSW